MMLALECDLRRDSRLAATAVSVRAEVAALRNGAPELCRRGAARPTRPAPGAWNPTWSFYYRKLIGQLTAAGLRCVAPGSRRNGVVRQTSGYPIGSRPHRKPDAWCPRRCAAAPGRARQGRAAQPSAATRRRGFRCGSRADRDNPEVCRTTHSDVIRRHAPQARGRQLPDQFAIVERPRGISMHQEHGLVAGAALVDIAQAAPFRKAATSARTDTAVAASLESLRRSPFERQHHAVDPAAIPSSATRLPSTTAPHSTA